MFQDSLSEGLKQPKESSSENEMNDIDIQDEEDEETIIEKRRKQREELLKVNSIYSEKVFSNFIVYYNFCSIFAYIFFIVLFFVGYILQLLTVSRDWGL